MNADKKNIRLSASDLSGHLACRHLTNLDLAVARRERAAANWYSPDAAVLRQRGMEHEQAYLAHLKTTFGIEVLDLGEVGDEREALAQTNAAMRRGAAAIAQATLVDGQWFGRVDVLRRVERASELGGWSYEVYDCKLATETKAATILQLSLYSELVGALQGLLPEWMFVVPPSEGFREERYRVLDYAAYYRYVKDRLRTAVEGSDGLPLSYPEPNAHCEVCGWFRECEGQRRRDDHLSLVAGISRLQRKQLAVWETTTMAALARLPLPILQKPEYGSKESYARVREQARLQVARRTNDEPVFEVLEGDEDHGFSLLPEASVEDVFFDLEGDPFVGSIGREYLFGAVFANAGGPPAYDSRWGLNTADEKEAFEWFVNAVMQRWARDAAMHVYHFTPYEPSALKRLMGRYASCENEIDQMLRAGLFVDLHRVLKRAVRASVEQYSLKDMEVFHRFERKLPLEEARRAMRLMQHALELGRVAEAGEDVRADVALYNADDCCSTLSLRDWLETERRELERKGQTFTRPKASDGAAPESVSERQQRIAVVAEALLQNVPFEREMRNEEESARWLLAQLLDWHRREAKAEWQEYFRLKEATDDELLNERLAIAGLTYVRTLDVKRKIPTDLYTFEKQDTDVRVGQKLCDRDQSIGTVVEMDVPKRTIVVKKMQRTAGVHPRSVFVDRTSPDDSKQVESLLALGRWVTAHGMDAAGDYRAARDLLLRNAPRLVRGPAPLVREAESDLDAAKRLILDLDHSVLAIQGPPGSGKTYSGARMICELVRNGKTIGITGMSHKVIRLLLDGVIAAAKEAGMPPPRCVQKVGEDAEDEDAAHIEFARDNVAPLRALQDGAQVVAGTSWLWAREEYKEAVDALFVDEAGQMSLANVLAVSQGAKSVVLLGDPQQLEQPLKGSHPEGAEASALEHLLGGAKTMPRDKGLFLEQTRRLHPKLCQFTSEVFYEGLLHPLPGLERQKLGGHAWLGEAGLWFVPVKHEGNQNSAPEEVARIAEIVDSLLQPDVTWTDVVGTCRPLRLEDILIVAPYNAQVSDLGARLEGARIGTVDKFQGQEAPVVIYSLTTSTPEDAPRGMEFLYSLNRLNVATSRAQGMVILVGSPRLLEPECQSPRQMQLANALCRYVEMAGGMEKAAGVG